MSTVVSPSEFIRVATNTAQHFGFRSVDALKKDPRAKKNKRTMAIKVPAISKRLDQMGGLLAGGISAYFDAKLNGIEEGVLFFTVEQVPRSGEVAISLQVIGVEKSIAEAMLIQTLRSVLHELGYANYSVRVNSLGDRDSVLRYTRELTNFLKKRLDDMPPQSRELMKDHALLALMDLIERDEELAKKSPSPLEYLSDPSRRHFREIVEYLDMSSTPYEIDTRLVGHHFCYSDTLFSVEICDEENNTLAQPPLTIRGGRYSEFVKRMTRSQTPAVGAVIVLNERKAPSRFPRIEREGKPDVCVIQLGFGPKIRSLLLLDELKTANICIHQNLVSDSLGEQLRRAEHFGVPFTIILGQKEYVEGTVILRDMRSRSQECIPISTLASHLRRVVKK